MGHELVRSDNKVSLPLAYQVTGLDAVVVHTIKDKPIASVIPINASEQLLPIIIGTVLQLLVS